MSSDSQQQPPSPLAAPAVNPGFLKALDELAGLARQGQPAESQFFNPPIEWLYQHMPVLQDMPEEAQQRIFTEASAIDQEAEEANAAGRAATRAWPEVVVRLDSGGLAFFSQLGVVRRPDLTQYFVDDFVQNRDALSFSETNQALFSEVLERINDYMRQQFASGQTIIQTDRQICDAPGRSFHARQLLFGARYMQIPIMWRQLTFDLPEEERAQAPDILEVSIPNWLEDLDLSDDLKARIEESGLTKLVFKAPTKGLSLHLGFDYVGEHKMGPLSIAMFLVKQAKGLAIQAALSMARVKTLEGVAKNTALITVGPSLHGKSTLTIMIELANSNLAQLLSLKEDQEEGVYPMNDDIVLLQPLSEPIEVEHNNQRVRITHGIDGTENNFYAMPFGLNQEEDPITYQAIRGTKDAPNDQETLENVPINMPSGGVREDGVPNYMLNPVRNMRVTLSRPRLIDRKNAQHLIEAITNGRLKDSVHVPMETTDRIFWQAVMRQNTIIPPLRKLSLEQYIRVLMYGEAVQMGAAVGAIGRPYVEYFSDPFIIGLEDENANLLYHILREIDQGGMAQEYYVFNTGGVGADVNDEASGARYRKIPRELTLMLQEALLREAVVFEHDNALGSDIAVAIVGPNGDVALDLREEWSPKDIYGEEDYIPRMRELSRRRYYSRDAADKAGILRYTKIEEAILDISDIPAPAAERELAWLLSFYWHVDQAYNSLSDLNAHLDEGTRPSDARLATLGNMYRSGVEQGLVIPAGSEGYLGRSGIG